MPSTYPTAQTLQQIALSHARCRTLSEPTRQAFQTLADGGTVEPDAIDAAMWETLASCATRAGQSMTRRAMVEALNRLKRAVYDNEGALPDRVVDVRMPLSALRLISDLLDVNDDDDTLVTEYGYKRETVETLRDAVRETLGR